MSQNTLTTQVPFYSFDYMDSQTRDAIREKFDQVFESHRFILGPEVEAFEAAFAQYCNSKYCVGVASGLGALEVALRTLDIGEGDEVIVPANTFYASVLAISNAGAKPVLVEPREGTCNLNPDLIEAAITPATKAIMPVHLYGQACEMGPIMAIAQQHHLFVIEDNAQSQGATWDGQTTGSIGDIAGTSFYPGKNLGALGDAGGLTTNNEAYYEKAKMLRNYGSAKKYYHDLKAFNCRLDEMQAAFLAIKLPFLDGWNKMRQATADQYRQQLQGVGDLQLLEIADKATCVYHQFPIRTQYRDSLQQHLNDNGVGTIIHYPIPPHIQKAYEDLGVPQGSLPITEKMAVTLLSLPIFPGIANEQVERVTSLIRAFFENQ